MTRRDLLRAGAVGALAALAPAGLADRTREWLELERRELRLPQWDADGFRVAVLSDFHVNTPADVNRTQRALRMALDAQPDLIALPGDFVDTSRRQVLRLLERAMEPLHDARCPVVATMGNHDYWVPRPAEVVRTLESLPLRLLRNEMVDVQGVSVAGVDDAIAGRDRVEFLSEPHRSKSLLVLFHEPDEVEQLPSHVSLQVSGHSHGGQICLPGGIAIHTPKGARRYTRGFYPDARVPLYVTRGIGTTGPELRLFCRPEVSLLTLRRA